ncbi:RHS repeat-associated core domain-containing protein [Pandoraea sputorum]|uniref:tRNA(Glu)-specific nuclease WapA n=1 Tax=Pandoraea sputorum TaxID=93222 RepID=A0A5E5B7Z7_9BURK|nr:RHS repeat-associated core domain-containing protein [Pandoraea sputorum]VVE81115.1 tRNA(Glu)-specific nuclease WapA [Pandoraea sputorum]
MQAIKHFSSSAQLAFETYAALNRKILVSPQSGEGMLRIPIAELFADASASPSFNLSFSCKTRLGDLDLIPCGFIVTGSPISIRTAKDHFEDLPLYDGRSLTIDMNSGETFNGGDFVIKRDGTSVVVYHKNGTCEAFVVSPIEAGFMVGEGLRGPIYPIRYVSPSGRSLTFEWKSFADRPHITAINDDDGRILDVEWIETKRELTLTATDISALKKVVLFPKSDQEITFTFSGDLMPFGFKKSIEVTGATGSAKTTYYIEKNDGNIRKFQIHRKSSIPPDKVGNPNIVETSTHTESLEFSDKKIVKHTTSPGGGVTPLVESYKFDTGKTIVACKQGDKTALTRVYTFADNRQTETVTAAGVTVVTEQTVSIDKTRGIATHKIIKKIGNVVVDERTLEYDAIGNLVRSTKDDTVTEWTYFNNYNAYTVTEKATNYQDTSFFGCLLKALDYANPIGLGFVAFGSGGLTWGTKIETTVDMAVSSNDYAQVAFHLPCAMNYPGDPKGFTSHVESEIVYRKVGDKQYAQRLTYFSYQKFIPKTVPNVVRPHVPLPHRKLTVFQPAYKEVDVSAEQLLVAKAAAKALLESLAKQYNSTKDKDEKTNVQSLINDLNKSLSAQSKANARGFKLDRATDGKWTDGSMHLEENEYQTNTDDPGFGQVSTNTTWLIGAMGNKVPGSELKSTFSYKKDAKDKRKLTVRTTIRSAQGTSVTTSQTRSSLTGRVYETIDGENLKTQYTYDKSGLLVSAKASRDNVTLGQRDYSITPIKGKHWRYQTSESPSGQSARVVRDELSRERQALISPDGKKWLQMKRSDFDSQGRLNRTEEFDYDHANTKHSTLTTTWTYDDVTNKCTVKKVLKDANEKVLDTKSLVLTSGAMSETMLVGSVETARSYDAAKRLLIETSGAPNAPVFRKLSAFDVGGNLTSVSIETIGSDRKVTAGDKTTLTYDDYGRLKTLTPKIGEATIYSYDKFDRLITSTTNDVEIINSYSATSLANVATGCYFKHQMDDLATELGTQTIDGLGRPTSQTINGTTVKFSYEGASRWSRRDDMGSRPETLKGYKSELDSSKLKYTETITDDSGTRISRTTSSRRGLMLEFDDATGTNTKYQYDAFGRLIGMKSNVCESSFTYADNGLLSKETVKAVTSGITMTVHYSYNASGIEINRKFECTGLKTHIIESQRMDDGRIDRVLLKVDNKIVNGDHFEYDASHRLSSWHCTHAGSEAADGKKFVKQVFWYDWLGNIESSNNEFYTGNTRPETLSISTIMRGYDSSRPGVLTSLDGAAMTNDKVGRLTKRVNQNLTYHANGQLKSHSATASGKDGGYVFSYDDLGRVRGGSAGKGKWTDTYHYRGAKPYAVVQQDDEKKHGFQRRILILKNDSPSCLLQYASTTIGDKTTGSYSFELRDQAGTVFASVDLASKAITYYRYSPYGYRNVKPNAVTWLGFKGEPLNYVGFYHLGNGYRHYDPEAGRFQTPDNMSPFDVGGCAAYVYCGGDPVNYHDPSGHQTVAQYSRLETMPAIYTKEFRIVAAVVEILSAPFTAGTSLALAIALVGIAAVSGAFSIASTLLEDSDPELSDILGYLGMGLGVAAPHALQSKVMGRAARLAASRRSGLGGNIARGRIAALARESTSRIRAGKNILALESSADPFQLQAVGPHLERLGVFSPGSADDAFDMGGAPAPGFFLASVIQQAGFSTEQVFNVNASGRGEGDLIGRASYPKNYYESSANVPNPLRSQPLAASYLKDVPALAKLPAFDTSEVFTRLSHQYGVDVSRSLSPMSLEQAMNILRNANYVYKDVDGGFCRPTLSATAPGFAKAGIDNLLDGIDWWQGARMLS